MSDFAEFLNTLKGDLLEWGRGELKEEADALLSAGQEFAGEAEDDLQEWTLQLERGEMSVDGFRMAVAGRMDVAKMEALKQTGLAAIRIDKLRKGILDTIVSAAARTFL